MTALASVLVVRRACMARFQMRPCTTHPGEEAKADGHCRKHNQTRLPVPDQPSDKDRRTILRRKCQSLRVLIAARLGDDGRWIVKQFAVGKRVHAY